MKSSPYNICTPFLIYKYLRTIAVSLFQISEKRYFRGSRTGLCVYILSSSWTNISGKARVFVSKTNVAAAELFRKNKRTFCI